MIVLQVAVCDEPDCSFSTVYVLDSIDKTAPALTLSFSWGRFAWMSMVGFVLVVLVACLGRYYRNRGRLLNRYTLMPYTSSLVVDSRGSSIMRVCCVVSLIGAVCCTCLWFMYVLFLLSAFGMM